MINLADLDDSSSYLGQLKETAGPVTIVNTFVAPEGKDLYKKAAVEGICEGE